MLSRQALQQQAPSQIFTIIFINHCYYKAMSMQVENTPQVTPLPPCSTVLPLASLPLVSFVPQFLILFSYHQCIDDFLLSLKSRTHKGHLQCLSFWD